MEEPQKRDANGRILPGTVLNPGGRPKGFGSYIRERTGNGQELVDFAVDIFRGTGIIMGDGKLIYPTLKDRQDAMNYLSDRGFGKAVQQVEQFNEDVKIKVNIIDDVADHETRQAILDEYARRRFERMTVEEIDNELAKLKTLNDGSN